MAISACGGGDDAPEVNPFGLSVETVAEGENPVALTFAPDGRMFFAEKYTGVIRVIDPSGSLLDEPFADADVANWLNLDWGLTGLAVDPEFESNGFLYAFYAGVFTASDTEPIAKPVLVRYTDADNRGTQETVLISNLPSTRVGHQGYKATGEIQFAADDALYLSLGDYDWNAEGPNGISAAQDLSVPMGKVLRVDRSGRPLPDNPFADNPDADARIFSYGFNRASAIAMNPQSNGVYTTDTTGSCEELNILVAGGNYGWPDVGEFPYPDCYFGNQVDPVHLFTRPMTKAGDFQSGPGVTGLAFVSGAAYPSLGDGLLVCESETAIMRRLVLSGPGLNEVTDDDVVVDDCPGDVAVAPNGTIYYSSKTQIKRLIVPAQTVTAAP